MRFWRRAPSFISVLLLFAGVASGCRDRVWDFGYQLRPPDGGAADAPKVDAPTDRTAIDLTGFGGFGGSGFGGVGGSGGASGAAGSGGGVVLCDNNSPQRETDILNCGTCFKSCVVPNSEPSCVAKVCGFTCFPNFFDADKIASNGCECVKTNAG